MESRGRHEVVGGVSSNVVELHFVSIKLYNESVDSAICDCEKMMIRVRNP